MHSSRGLFRKSASIDPVMVESELNRRMPTKPRFAQLDEVEVSFKMHRRVQVGLNCRWSDRKGTAVNARFQSFDYFSGVHDRVKQDIGAGGRPFGSDFLGFIM